MLIASLLFGISASLDALLVGISYGIRGIRIHFWQNLVISLITLLGTCLSVGLGQHLASLLPDVISEYAGSLVLILLGLYYIAKWLWACRFGSKVPPEEHAARLRVSVPRDTGDSFPKDQANSAFRNARTKQSGTANSDLHTTFQNESRPEKPCLKVSEILSLSLVLSLNNLSAGFSASLTGLTLASASASTFVCSVLFLFSGNRLGGSPVLQLAGTAAEPLSGILLISLGIVQLFLQT